MNKLILTKGLPASGKTTWVNEQVAGSNGKIININKDDLRAMLHAGKGSKYRESFVIEVQETLTKLAFEAGHDVIWSDTNLNPIHENRARTLSDCVEIVDHFLQVSIEDCISRDKNRINPVGEKAIRDQYNKWLRKAPELLVQDETKQKALIVDVDGTLAHMSGRSPFDWSRVGEDSVDDTVADVVRLHKAAGYDIIIVSGRDAVCRQITEDWLDSHNIPFDYIYMRAQGDSRKDYVVKREIFDNYIRVHWNIKFVLDDRNSVVKTWREIGLKCFQVAEGDF
jgi:predicted kinase